MSASASWALVAPQREKVHWRAKGFLNRSVVPSARTLRASAEPFRVFVRPRSEGRGFAMAADSDTDLIARIRAGDQLALKALYGRHGVKVYRFALRMLRSEPSAEDVVSEVFTDVWRKPTNFEGRSEASTWLLAMARNKAVSILRRDREGELDDDAAAAIEDEADDPEVVLQKKSKGELLRVCLSRLSPLHREVIDLVYYHDKSIEEVALIVGAPEGTVKTRMFHARKKLCELARAAGVDRGWP
jgi:RNA polymerase sigma-70 factor, ECF subfamily